LTASSSAFLVAAAAAATDLLLALLVVAAPSSVLTPLALLGASAVALTGVLVSLADGCLPASLFGRLAWLGCDGAPSGLDLCVAALLLSLRMSALRALAGRGVVAGVGCVWRVLSFSFSFVSLLRSRLLMFSREAREVRAASLSDIPVPAMLTGRGLKKLNIIIIIKTSTAAYIYWE
jgi:hypothetical protein